MSTNPERLLPLLVQWLDGGAADDDVKRALAELRLDELAEGERELVKELRAAFEDEARPREDREMLAREAVDALTLG